MTLSPLCRSGTPMIAAVQHCVQHRVVVETRRAAGPHQRSYLAGGASLGPRPAVLHRSIATVSLRVCGNSLPAAAVIRRGVFSHRRSSIKHCAPTQLSALCRRRFTGVSSLLFDDSPNPAAHDRRGLSRSGQQAERQDSTAGNRHAGPAGGEIAAAAQRAAAQEQAQPGPAAEDDERRSAAQPRRQQDDEPPPRHSGQQVNQHGHHEGAAEHHQQAGPCDAGLVLQKALQADEEHQHPDCRRYPGAPYQCMCGPGEEANDVVAGQKDQHEQGAHRDQVPAAVTAAVVVSHLRRDRLLDLKRPLQQPADSLAFRVDFLPMAPALDLRAQARVHQQIDALHFLPCFLAHHTTASRTLIKSKINLPRLLCKSVDVLFGVRYYQSHHSQDEVSWP